MSTVYTVGHSSRSFQEFARLLSAQNIEVVVDVRSAPYSRFAPQFDRELIQRALTESGFKYLYLGTELGGRPKDPSCYDSEDHVLYGQMTKDPAFVAGIARLEKGIAAYRVALMCGEENPAHCHRRLLVGRVLVSRGHQVLHLRADGKVETEEEIAASSGKPLVTQQPALFAELDEDQWRSTASVSPKKARASSSER